MVEKMKTLAEERGSAEVQFMLGFIYAVGREVPQDDKEAVKWYRKAANQGYAEGQVALGMMYAEGRGVPQDNEVAYFWTKLAAKQDRAYIKRRNLLYQRLSPEQRERAQKRAREWRPISPE